MLSLKEAIMTISKPEMLNKFNNRSLIIFGVMLLGFGWLLYQSGLLLFWLEDEEYGHGMMVIGLLGYLLYRNRSRLLTAPVSVSWLGIFISVTALIIFILGEVAGIAQVRMYGIWLFGLGAIFSIGGWVLFRKLLVPLLIIFLLIPLPGIFGPLLTAELQLISSKIGVWVIRLFGGIVFLEGNVIDMGEVKLLVAEACSGLRYLFPLMSIGAIAGYLMRAPVWMRWTIFLTTIPVTIFMNSFRIGVTGLLTEAYGPNHTEGFLHFFEGWVVFVASLIILIGFAWLLTKLLPDSPAFAKVFSFDHVFDTKEDSIAEKNQNWQTKPAVLFMLFSLIIAVIVSSPFFEREETIVVSKPLFQFPTMLGQWRASESRLPPSIEAVAGASEYYYGDFLSPSNDKVNVYIAYYQDQKQGAAPHSPKVCIPGDGWVITNDEPVSIKSKNGKSYEVSRLIITKDKHTIVTYYWLKQGKNVFRQQFMARLNLIWFAIAENRADAALIRMVSEVGSNEKIEDTDARMQEMATKLLYVISDYVPD